MAARELSKLVSTYTVPRTSIQSGAVAHLALPPRIAEDGAVQRSPPGATEMSAHSRWDCENLKPPPGSLAATSPRIGIERSHL